MRIYRLIEISESYEKPKRILYTALKKEAEDRARRFPSTPGYTWVIEEERFEKGLTPRRLAVTAANRATIAAMERG